MSATLTQSPEDDRPPHRRQLSRRVESVDAIRGLVMFAMIFVNDIASAKHVPAWMKHKPPGEYGMTFVDLVFPAFLFIVGMSIPLAIGPRLARGQSLVKAIGHVLLRTIALLAIGIMMVNSDLGPTLGPSSEKMGWSSTAWTVLMYLAAIFSFCQFSRGKNASEVNSSWWRRFTLVVRSIGIAGMIALAMSFRSGNDKPILRLHPFFIRHAWYGILGVIGWAYLVASIVYLTFRNRRTALLACAALVMCLYVAGDLFSGFWVARHVNIPSALGSHAAISVAGVLLGSILLTADTSSHWARIRFTIFYVIGFAIAAILLTAKWPISKEEATPPWCFAACAITAALWLLFYLIDEVARGRALLKPIAVAGRNVLLAYLISEMLPSALDFIHLHSAYSHLAEPTLSHAVARSSICATVILAVTAFLNRLGFFLRI